jgi:hypothetical protein
MRNIGIWSVGLVVLAVSLFFLVRQNNAGAQQYQADDYRGGQDQFIELIGEEEFARFEHNHPPLNCSDADWEADPQACSETWLHRFEIGQILNPAGFEEDEESTSEPDASVDPTTVPAQ